jgi:hypothetical protein
MNGGFTVDTWSDDEGTTSYETHDHNKYGTIKVIVFNLNSKCHRRFTKFVMSMTQECIDISNDFHSK